MGRMSKIEKFNLQKTVADAIAKGKSARQIAEICSRQAKQSISHVAVSEYIRTINPKEKREEVAKSTTRVAQIVSFDIDIMQMQLRTTSALLERFEFVDELPKMFEEQIGRLESTLQAGDASAETLNNWKIGFVDELRRNVQSITVINRELRENSKFMADFREKSFNFDLSKEFVDIFINSFRSESPEACDAALQKVLANPRMQRIVEVMQLRTGA